MCLACLSARNCRVTAGRLTLTAGDLVHPPQLRYLPRLVIVRIVLIGRGCCGQDAAESRRGLSRMCRLQHSDGGKLALLAPGRKRGGGGGEEGRQGDMRVGEAEGRAGVSLEN